jgi:hypothetical protein
MPPVKEPVVPEIADQPEPRACTGRAPENAADSTLPANYVECLDCMESWTVRPNETTDCRNVPSHLVDPFYAVDRPLGYTDDDDYYNHARDRYEYPAREITATT